MMSSTNKLEMNNTLDNLLSNLPLEQPSEDFNRKVMNTLHSEIKRKKYILQFVMPFAISISILAALGIPILIFNILGITFEFDFPKFLSSLKISGLSATICITGTFLLSLSSYLHSRTGSNAKDR